LQNKVLPKQKTQTPSFLSSIPKNVKVFISMYESLEVIKMVPMEE